MRFAVIDRETGAFHQVVDLTHVDWKDEREILVCDPPSNVGPGWVFRDGEWTDTTAPVPPPDVISDRQFAQVLAMDGVITEAEAIAWAARGDLPTALTAAVNQLPADQRFSAHMLLSAATTYERSHPLVPVLGAIIGKDAVALDSIWERGSAL